MTHMTLCLSFEKKKKEPRQIIETPVAIAGQVLLLLIYKRAECVASRPFIYFFRRCVGDIWVVALSISLEMVSFWKKKGAFSRIAVAKLLFSQHSNCFDILLEQRTSFRSTSLLTTDYAHTKINSVVALLIFHIKKNYQDPKASMHILFTSLDTKIDIFGGI